MDMKMLSAVALSLVLCVVILGIGATLTNQIETQMRTVTPVTNESHALASVPTLITVANTPVVDDSETIYWQNATSGESALLQKDVNYTVVSYYEGKFNITSVAKPLGTDTNALITYKYRAVSTASDIVSRGISAIRDLANWLPIIVIAVAGVLIITLIVRAFGGFGIYRAGE